MGDPNPVGASGLEFRMGSFGIFGEAQPILLESTRLGYAKVRSELNLYF